MATKEATIKDCDDRIAKAWQSLRDDPTADSEACRREIDIWLDTRLLLMRKRENQK